MQICVDQNLGQSGPAQNDKMTAGAFHEPDFDENLFTQGANTLLVKISEKLKIIQPDQILDDQLR